MLIKANQLGWDFWGRAVIAILALGLLPVGISNGSGRLIFGSLIITALFGHLAFLRLREVRNEGAIRMNRAEEQEKSKND